MATQDKSCSVAPYFRVKPDSLEAFKILCAECVEKASTEEGCLYYGFSFNGDMAFCREGYMDADALLAHLANVGATLDKMLALSELSQFEVHGPASEIQKLRGPLSGMNPTYFVLAMGFRR